MNELVDLEKEKALAVLYSSLSNMLCVLVIAFEQSFATLASTRMVEHLESLCHIGTRRKSSFGLFIALQALSLLVPHVESHGTGTSAGDSTEASALGAVFGHHESTEIGDSVYIGSLKSNIGHLEGVSGVFYPLVIFHPMIHLAHRVNRLLVLLKQL